MSPLMGLPTRGRSSCVAKRTTPPLVNTAKWSSICGALHAHRPAREATNECATFAGQNPVKRRITYSRLTPASVAFRFNSRRLRTEGHTTTRVVMRKTIHIMIDKGRALDLGLVHCVGSTCK